MLSHFSLIEEKADLILVDTGAGISKNVLSFAMASDECLVVTTPEPTARLDAYGLIKVLHQEGYEGVTRLIVNMAESQDEGQEVGRLMETLAKRFLNAHLEYLGCVPQDQDVRRAVSRCRRPSAWLIPTAPLPKPWAPWRLKRPNFPEQPPASAHRSRASMRELPC